MTQLIINVLIEGNLNADIDSALSGFEFFLNVINQCDSGVTALYAQGESLEEALENKIIDIDGSVNPNAEKYMGRNIPIASGLWDGNSNEIRGLSIMFVRFDQTSTSITISIGNYEVGYNKESLLRLIDRIANKFHIQYISIRFTGKPDQVFPDRPPVGWMIYLPVKLEKAKLKNAQDVVDITSQMNSGTVIISTVEYEPGNIAHGERANDIEIELVDLGLLPRFADFK